MIKLKIFYDIKKCENFLNEILESNKEINYEITPLIIKRNILFLVQIKYN